MNLKRSLSTAGVAAMLAAAATLAPAATAGPPKFQLHVLPGGAGHTEPSIVVDAQGRAFVSAIAGVTPNTTNGELGTPIWRSSDYVHWTKLHTASAGPLGSPLGGGDSALVLDSAGDVFATDLWLGDDSITISTDHGDTFVGAPVSHRLADDRTWLAFSPKDDQLYQVYDGVDGLYIARADLSTPLGARGALTFAFNNRIVAEVPVGSSSLDALPARQAVAPPGGVAVDPRTGEVYASYADQDGVAIATSTDQGLTWQISHIPHSSSTGSYLDDSWNFQPITTDSRGNVYVAWSQVQEQGQQADPSSPHGVAVYVAASTDHGRSWRVQKVRTQATALLPALTVIAPGKIGISWVDASATGNPNTFPAATRWTLRYAEMNALGTSCQRAYVVDPHAHSGSLFAGPQGGDRGMGDFFELARTPNGSTLIAYTQGQDSGDSAIVAVLPRHTTAC